jgi:hypothetical protein
VGFVVLDPVLRIRKIVDYKEISWTLMRRKNSSFSPLFSTEPSFTREISDYEHFGSNLYSGEEIFGVVFLNLRFLELQKP